MDSLPEDTPSFHAMHRREYPCVQGSRYRIAGIDGLLTLPVESQWRGFGSVAPVRVIEFRLDPLEHVVFHLVFVFTEFV